MHISINGKSEEFVNSVSIAELIKGKCLDAETLVAELNREIIPGEKFAETRLQDGDRLELVQFVGGG